MVRASGRAGLTAGGPAAPSELCHACPAPGDTAAPACGFAGPRGGRCSGCTPTPAPRPRAPTPAPRPRAHARAPFFLPAARSALSREEGDTPPAPRREHTACPSAPTPEPGVRKPVRVPAMRLAADPAFSTCCLLASTAPGSPESGPGSLLDRRLSWGLHPQATSSHHPTGRVHEWLTVCQALRPRPCA